MELSHVLRGLELEQLLDIPGLTALLERFNRLTNAGSAILDLRGRVLVSVGWQDACVRFHRVHPLTCCHCKESDLYLAGNVQPGEHVAYRCKNGLWDVVTPLVVEGLHLGNVYTGQFFYDDEQIDLQEFAARADECGFDREAYLDAISRVPRLSRHRVAEVMEFLVGLTRVMSEQAMRTATETALRRAEAARRRSEAELHLVLDTIPQSVFWKDRAGHYLGCNPVFARAAGLDTPEQVIGKTDFDLPWPRHEAEAYRADDQEVIEQDRPKEHILEELQQADGTRLWIDTTKVPLHGEDGRVLGVLGVYEDVTDRKRAEEALRESEAKFVLAFRNAPSLMSITDVETGTFFEVNDAFLRASGYTREELLGRTSLETGWISAAARERMVRQLGEDGRVSGVVLDVAAKDGHTITCITNGEVITIGGREYLLAAAQDITALVQSQRALQASEERYRLLAENARDMIWTMDLEGRFTYVSPSVERLRGYSPAEVTRQSLEEVLTPESAALAQRELQAGLERLAATGELPEFRGELEQPCKDGSTVWTDVTASALRGADGEVVGVVGVSRDISEQKLAREEKAQLEARLVQAQKLESVGRLAGGVAHDFNNMLGVILGHVEIALDRLDPDAAVRDDLDEIHKAAKRSAELTRQLLTFARRQTIAPKVMDLNRSVDGMLRLLQRLIGEDIRLDWLPAPDLWPVRMDPSQVDQVLANLCVNARDAISGQGGITIQSGNSRFDEAFCASHPEYKPGEFVCLAVRDDGSGMSTETMSHLFEPFFTTKGVGRGTGLGLATVYGIAQQNHGFVTAESRLGAGTTIAVYLPRHEGDAALAHGEPIEGTLPRGHHTILLVEDEPAMLRMSRAILERLGYRVLSAQSPDEAIRVARQNHQQFSLLLTDVVMPEMNGRRLAELLHAEHPHFKALFMSGYTDDVTAERGVAAGELNFIQKPFSMRQIAAKLEQMLGGAHGVGPPP